jgi:hypothetical protein
MRSTAYASICRRPKQAGQGQRLVSAAASGFVGNYRFLAMLLRRPGDAEGGYGSQNSKNRE